MLNETINTSEIVKKVKGKVTVELIDAKSGEVVQKQEKDNFIANNGVEYLQYLQHRNFKDQVKQLGPVDADKEYEPLKPFETVALTDSVAAAAPNDEWNVPGKLIGYAIKEAYSGPDSLRGTPNSVLSATSPSFTKWVFDWPTNAANGTIASVCWNVGYKASDYYNSDYRLPIGITKDSTLLKQQPTTLTGRPIAYASANLLFAGTGTSVSSYDAQLASISSFSTIDVKGIAWDSGNSKLWVISGTQIASYSSTGTLIDGPTNVTNRAYRGLTFDGTSLWTLVNWQVYQIDTSGNDVSNFDGYFGPLGVSLSREGVLDISYNADSGLLEIMAYGLYASGSARRTHIASQGFSASGIKSNLLTYLMPNYKGNRVLHYYSNNQDYLLSYFDIAENNKWVQLIDVDVYYNIQNAPKFPYSGTSLLTLRIEGMGSRALLPSPITKTSSQSLRITYQMDYS